MDLNLENGRYVVAVSGGVDSMALLGILKSNPDLELIVAHFDHGIRYDSHLDRQNVQLYAKNKGLKFVYSEGNLGPETSEAKARKARYDFLHSLRQASNSRAIITAHHQDDLLETAIINMIRGSGRSGLSSLDSKNSIVRPVLHLTKNDLVNYAKRNDISWREDSTNKDVKYLRNYIRHTIIPKMTEEQRTELLDHINHIKDKNNMIDEILTSVLHLQPALDVINRKWFIMLPYSVSKEVMASWLKKHNIKDVDKKTIIRLVNFAKTSQPNRDIDLDSKCILRISNTELGIIKRNR